MRTTILVTLTVIAGAVVIVAAVVGIALQDRPGFKQGFGFNAPLPLVGDFNQDKARVDKRLRELEAVIDEAAIKRQVVSELRQKVLDRCVLVKLKGDNETARSLEAELKIMESKLQVAEASLQTARSNYCDIHCDAKHVGYKVISCAVMERHK